MRDNAAPGESPRDVGLPRADESDPSKYPAHIMPPMEMPGEPGQLAREIDQIGVEGRPADPKSGPGKVLLEAAALLGVVAVATLIASVVTDWSTGLVVLGVGCLGVLFNPTVWAALMRARDRQDIVDEHTNLHGRPGRHG